MARRGRVPGVARRIAALLLAAAPVALPAAEVRYEGALLSRYVWRGFTLTDGPVFQPAVRISHESGFAFEGWASVDLDDVNDRVGEVSETRLTLDWSRRFGAVELGAGLVEYLFPNTEFPGTREVALRVGLAGVVAPRLELAYDVDEIEGLYARFALGWERPLGSRWRFAAEGSAAWADARFAVGGEAGPHDAAVVARFLTARGPCELRLEGGWTGSLDEEVLPEQPAHVWAGVALAARL